MNILRIAFLIIIPLVCQAQSSVRVRLLGKTICSDQAETLDIYALEKDDSVYVASMIEYLVLPDTGTYILHVAGTFDDSLKIHIPHYGVFTDTIALISIGEYPYLPQTQEYNIWLCCDKKCNGYQSDYDKAGNLRMDGIFKKGKARGPVKYYNADGSLYCIYHYDKKGKLIHIEGFW